MAEMPSVTMVSPDEVIIRCKADPDILILDVRNEDEWAVHHIEGALLVPMHTLRLHLAELDPNRETVVVCEHGQRSLSVAQFLVAQAGFTVVSNMVGGMSQWTGPVVTGE